MQCNDGCEYQNTYGANWGYRQPPLRSFLPLVTWLLLAANVLFFLYLEWQGSTQDGHFMIEHGTMVSLLVVEWKEYYRVFTAFFMHFGLLSHGFVVSG